MAQGSRGRTKPGLDWKLWVLNHTAQILDAAREMFLFSIHNGSLLARVSWAVSLDKACEKHHFSSNEFFSLPQTVQLSSAQIRTRNSLW